MAEIVEVMEIYSRFDEAVEKNILNELGCRVVFVGPDGVVVGLIKNIYKEEGD